MTFMTLLARMDGWNSAQRIRAHTACIHAAWVALLVILTGAVVKFAAGAQVAGTGLTWAGFAIAVTAGLFSTLLRRTGRRADERQLAAHEAWMRNAEAQKRDLIAKINQKAGGEEALAAQRICRYCGTFTAVEFANPDSPAVAGATRTALLRHEAACEHRPPKRPPAAPQRPMKLFGMGPEPPTRPHRWYLSWGWVTESDGDETGDYDTAWDRFRVWIGRAGKPPINLWRGRRKPFYE
jgi:hypothetical protein